MGLKSHKHLYTLTLCVLRCLVMSSSLQPHELQPIRLLCPWNFPSKNTKWVTISSSNTLTLLRGRCDLKDRSPKSVQNHTEFCSVDIYKNIYFYLLCFQPQTTLGIICALVLVSRS